MKRGLNKMARTHVHFTASDKIDGQNVVSGYRKDCEILIYLDIKKITSAIQNNDLVFQISENNVILCAGDDEGFVDKKYFWKVIDRKSGKDILNEIK